MIRKDTVMCGVCWLDHLNNHICFLGWNEKQVIYNADGSYSGELKNPVEATVFPANTVINYLDEKTFVAHSTAGGGQSGSSDSFS